MTRSTIKKLKEPLDEPERELHRRRRAASRQQQNDSLAIVGRNLFDNEASSSANSEPKPTPPLKSLREHSSPNLASFQNPIVLLAKQTGNIISHHGGTRLKAKGEEGPEWVVRSKFEDKLSNFMLEKNLQAKGLGEMLDQHRNGMHEQFSQILTTFGKIQTPMHKHDAATFAIITRSGTTTRDPPYPTPLSPTSINNTRRIIKKEGPEDEETTTTQERDTP
ncbi:hypothetical protein Tco_0939203 [Tanacetum coccineum]|uniref:Uncharacterized protein n=1 Tax=Tanacetum coccineum TaxID=301880 RepID=A0ABQ5DKC2_9ASTR